MNLSISIPAVAELRAIYHIIAGWQQDDGPVQLHPGDIGWLSGRGIEQAANALRVWTQNGQVVAIGMMDGPDVLRMAVDPARSSDQFLATEIAKSIHFPNHSVLPAGEASVEARGWDSLAIALRTFGWGQGEEWATFRWKLAEPIGPINLEIETVEPQDFAAWAEVHWSAFKNGPMPDDARDMLVSRLVTMATGPFADTTRIIAGRDESGTMAAIAMVWSAGLGRPGLLEPMGVHQDFRGRGYGTAITRAAALALQEMGASSIFVATDAANTGGVATYIKSGFSMDSLEADLQRKS